MEMKVVCIDNKISYELIGNVRKHYYTNNLIKKITKVSGLTLGKTYDAMVKYDGGKFYYNIYDDNKHLTKFNSDRFKLLEDVRYDKISQLGI